MSDERLLDDLHILGQLLQGLGEGPRPADEDVLLLDTQATLTLFLYRIRRRLEELADERAQHD